MRCYTELLLKHSKLSDVKMVLNENLWRPIDIYFQDGDSSLIKNELGWEPTIDIEKTINDLLYFWYNKLK